ncbi:BspA family leucine-rich repeat surface protein [Companilactobacillus sp. DQM5]|uniref:BspA family leucine-rich repeat surface protein n=1 Tax=Companilactobacillus sp. DQM5 TaxID=3463359 RepID=UPI004058FA51
MKLFKIFFLVILINMSTLFINKNTIANADEGNIIVAALTGKADSNLGANTADISTDTVSGSTASATISKLSGYLSNKPSVLVNIANGKISPINPKSYHGKDLVADDNGNVTQKDEIGEGGRVFFYPEDGTLSDGMSEDVLNGRSVIPDKSISSSDGTLVPDPTGKHINNAYYQIKLPENFTGLTFRLKGINKYLHNGGDYTKTRFIFYDKNKKFLGQYKGNLQGTNHEFISQETPVDTDIKIDKSGIPSGSAYFSTSLPAAQPVESVSMFFNIAPGPAHGFNGTSPWYIDKSGKLTTFEGQTNNVDLNEIKRRYGNDKINSIDFKTNNNEIIYAPKDSTNLFGSNNVGSIVASFSNLQSIDVTNLDVSKVENMDGMFNSLSKITSLNLKNWSTSNVKSAEDTFFGMNSLKEITLGEKFTTSVQLPNSDATHIWTNIETGTTLTNGEFDGNKSPKGTYRLYDIDAEPPKVTSITLNPNQMMSNDLKDIVVSGNWSSKSGGTGKVVAYQFSDGKIVKVNNSSDSKETYSFTIPKSEITSELVLEHGGTLKIQIQDDLTGAKNKISDSPSGTLKITDPLPDIEIPKNLTFKDVTIKDSSVLDERDQGWSQIKLNNKDEHFQVQQSTEWTTKDSNKKLDSIVFVDDSGVNKSIDNSPINIEFDANGQLKWLNDPDKGLLEPINPDNYTGSYQTTLTWSEVNAPNK